MNYKVDLYEIQENGRCKADLTIEELNFYVAGFLVVPGLNQGVLVHMPKGMGTDWSYTEVEWAAVRGMISAEYLKHPAIISMRADADHKADLEKKQETIIRFHDLIENADFRQAYVDFTLPGSSHEWKNFSIRLNADGTSKLRLPYNFRQKWMNPKYPWWTLSEMISVAFRDYVKQGAEAQLDASALDRKEVLHKEDNENGSSAVTGEEETNNSAVLTEELLEVDESIQQPADENKGPGSMFSSKQKDLLIKNRIGRIYNSDSKPFAFVPQSLLKPIAIDDSARRNIAQLVNAMNSDNGGIGPFEIQLIDYVSKFKYVSKSMLLDLITSGNISTFGRDNITVNKINDIMKRLLKYNLIETSNFVCVDDYGNPITEPAKYQVHTIGSMGYSLLRELGRHPERRNAMGILADGNTVKKQLSANQWLVYWLSHYEASDILGYSINKIVNFFGTHWTAARFHALISFEEQTIMAEPVRRGETFEQESGREELINKIERLIDLFDHSDQLYSEGREQVVYPTRPVICLICEDDEHIAEVLDTITPLLQHNPQQEVWFTNDARTFCYNKVGERFFERKGDTLAIVNLEKKLGLAEKTMEEIGAMRP